MAAQLAAMSGFRLISSGVLSGPDIGDNPGVRGVMTQPGHRAP